MDPDDLGQGSRPSKNLRRRVVDMVVQGAGQRARSLACIRIQASHRGRQARCETWQGTTLKERELQKSADRMEKEAALAVEDIAASRKRMDAALEQAEARINGAATTVQAAYRGKRTRTELNAGPDQTKAKAARERKNHYAEVFEETSRTADGKEPALDAAGFRAALREVHNEVRPPQAEALWNGFVHGMSTDVMNLESFCSIAEAVNTGSHAAAEFADMSVEAYQALANVPAPQTPPSGAGTPSSAQGQQKRRSSIAGLLGFR